MGKTKKRKLDSTLPDEELEIELGDLTEIEYPEAAEKSGAVGNSQQDIFTEDDIERGYRPVESDLEDDDVTAVPGVAGKDTELWLIQLPDEWPDEASVKWQMEETKGTFKGTCELEEGLKFALVSEETTPHVFAPPGGRAVGGIPVVRQATVIRVLDGAIPAEATAEPSPAPEDPSEDPSHPSSAPPPEHSGATPLDGQSKKQNRKNGGGKGSHLGPGEDQEKGGAARDGSPELQQGAAKRRKKGGSSKKGKKGGS